MAAYVMDTTRVKPVREIRMSKQGALLACGAPRYAELQEYLDMFAAPLSQLKGAGVLTFADPIADLVLVVECEVVDWCGRCDKSLQACACSF